MKLKRLRDERIHILYVYVLGIHIFCVLAFTFFVTLPIESLFTISELWRSRRSCKRLFSFFTLLLMMTLWQKGCVICLRLLVKLSSEATVLEGVQIVAKQVSLENSFPRSLSEVEGRGWWDGYLHNLPLSVSIVAALCKSSLNEDIVVVHIIIVIVSWQQYIMKSKLQPTSNKIDTCIDHKRPRTKNEGPLFHKISLRFIGEVYFSGHLQVWSLKKGPAKRMDGVKRGD